MLDGYLTIKKTAQTLIIIKKSRFIACTSPVNNEQDAQAHVANIKKEHSQANHNVFAYVVNKQIQRFSDDGEPSGTAGKPILEVIHQKLLSNLVITVTRYFGGIMLGAGGLIRAYREAAIKVIEEAEVVKKILHQELYITMDYQWLGLVKREVEKAAGKKIDLTYNQQVKMKVLLQPDTAKILVERIIEATCAQVIIQKGQFFYI